MEHFGRGEGKNVKARTWRICNISSLHGRAFATMDSEKFWIPAMGLHNE